MGERWELIDAEGWYEVSNMGRVRSWRCPAGTGRMTGFNILGGSVIVAKKWGKPYRRYGLMIGGRARGLQGSRLVLQAFDREPEFGEWACHVNGDTLDDRRCNLEWRTPQGVADGIKGRGSLPSGEDAHNTTLTSADVVAIRERYASGETQRALAADYGVAWSTIHRTVAGKTRAREGGPDAPPRRGGPRPRLSEDDVRDIRTSGLSRAVLAERHGVSVSMISLVRNGKSYKWVTNV